MLRTRGVDDEVGPGNRLGHARVESRPDGVPLERLREGVGGQPREPLAVRLADGGVDQVDVGDPVLPRRVDDLAFAGEQAAAGVQRHQERVRAVGDVVDETHRQADERAVVVDGVVEASAAPEEGAREHQVAQAAVGEVEREAASEQRVAERVEPLGHPGAQLAGQDCRQTAHLRVTGDRRGATRDRLEHGQRGIAVRPLGQAEIERVDERGRTGAERARDARGVLAEVGRAKRVAEEAPDLTRGQTVVVAVDRDGQRHVGAADQLGRQGGRASSAREQHDTQGLRGPDGLTHHLEIRGRGGGPTSARTDR